MNDTYVSCTYVNFLVVQLSSTLHCSEKFSKKETQTTPITYGSFALVLLGLYGSLHLHLSLLRHLGLHSPALRWRHGLGRHLLYLPGCWRSRLQLDGLLAGSLRPGRLFQPLLLLNLIQLRKQRLSLQVGTTRRIRKFTTKIQIPKIKREFFITRTFFTDGYFGDRVVAGLPVIFTKFYYGEQSRHLAISFS